jgi:hypothetical protein
LRLDFTSSDGTSLDSNGTEIAIDREFRSFDRNALALAKVLRLRLDRIALALAKVLRLRLDRIALALAKVRPQLRLRLNK